MRKLSAFVLLAGLLVLALPAQAQQVIEITDADMDRFVNLLQADLLQERANLVGEAMEFNADQSAAFWPMYTEYDKAVHALGQERWTLIKDFAASYEAMTDEVAAGLMERSFNIRQERMDMQRAFVTKVAGALGPQVAARFVQVDNQIQNVLDLQLAQQLPLIQKPE